MKNKMFRVPFVIALLFIVCTSVARASESSEKIVARDSEDNEVEIALDSSGTPRVNSNLNTYPTIKDFRDDSDFSSYCYVGKKKGVRKLLVSLVDAADGDGDSFVASVSIKINKKAVFTVVVNIEDESGENEEIFKFKPCK